MSLKRQWSKCNTVKSDRRWKRRPWKFMRTRRREDDWANEADVLACDEVLAALDAALRELRAARRE